MTALFTRFYELPHWGRGLFVAAFLGLIALVDVARNGKRATRWREYSFWLACGVVGAVFAVCNDLVTSRLSHAYFAVGKGLGDDDPRAFVGAVVGFAIRAGLVAGLAIGGALLLANNPERGLPQLRYRELARIMALPLLAAVVVAPMVAMSGSWDPQGLAPGLRQVMSEQDVASFLMVQRLHVGLYAGALLGAFGAIVWIRRRRKHVVGSV